MPQRCPDEESDRLRHAYTLPPDVFHTLHPFHMLIDAQGRVAKAGDGLLRLFPNMRSGSPIQEFFVVRRGTARALKPVCARTGGRQRVV